jgi:hypothetical protein
MKRALTASSFCTGVDSCFDSHAVSDDHRHVTLPHREVIAQQRLATT